MEERQRADEQLVGEAAAEPGAAELAVRGSAEPHVPGAASEMAARPVAETGIIRPVASADEVLAAWRQFQDLKRSLLTIEDYQDIQGRPRIKKSGWRKIAAAFGISDELLREERREIETPTGRHFVWEVAVRAIAPNGRYADAVGSCASTERRFAHLDHDVRATAHTRGKNRAIADLVGGGEVSAEEMIDGEVWEPPRPAAPAASGSATAPREVRPAAADDHVTDAQLRAIRAHLRRTGIDEARACARASVTALEALTRRAAAELLSALSRQPNAA
ncbi:MAG TPA: hypothetical protein VK066_14720 [Chloroflexota bacterium]|nr:hypothetical protein [Chloroflexota bacterium]